jgi:hypothetical protein
MPEKKCLKEGKAELQNDLQAYYEAAIKRNERNLKEIQDGPSHHIFIGSPMIFLYPINSVLLNQIQCVCSGDSQSKGNENK